MSETLTRGLRASGPPLDLLGRLLLVSVFIAEGWDKLAHYPGALAYMAMHGVPGALLPFAILVEIGCSLLVLAGWHTRLAALGLAVFSAAAAILFHLGVPGRSELLHFEKDLALAGAFLILAARGAGGLSLDALGEAGWWVAPSAADRRSRSAS